MSINTTTTKVLTGCFRKKNCTGFCCKFIAEYISRFF